MLTRFYSTSSLDLPQIAKSLETQYAGEGFQVQYVGDAEKLIVQVKKEGIVRFLLGFNKAIGVTLEHLGDGFLVKIGAQDWIDNAVV
jgi:hypothetical protein